MHINRFKPLSDNSMTESDRSRRGFTLAELAVVLVLLGLMLSVILPRFVGVGYDERLRSSARRLAGLALEAHSQAAAKARPWFFCLDLNTRRAWLSTVRPGNEGNAGRESRDFVIPSDVHVSDVSHPGLGTVKTGRLSFGYWPQGGSEPGAIHLKNDSGTQLTLFLRPYMGRTEVGEGYLVEETR